MAATPSFQPKIKLRRPGMGEALLFGARAALSAVIALLLYRLTGLPGDTWAPVSALIVIQTSLRTSATASLQRFAANLVGAFCGAACTLLHQDLAALVAGVILTAAICHVLHLTEVLRPGFAAVAIIVLTNSGHAFSSSLQRLLAVTLGCSVALVVTLVWEWIYSKVKPEVAEQQPGSVAEPEEG